MLSEFLTFYTYPTSTSVSLLLQTSKTASVNHLKYINGRKAHSERQELITQWEHTIEQMQRRDKEMDLLAAVSSSFMSNCLTRNIL